MKQLKMLYFPWELAERRVRKLLKPGVLVALGVGFLAFEHGGYWQAFVFGRWSLLLGIGGVALSWWLADQIGWVFLPLIATVIVSGIYTGRWHGNSLFQGFDILTTVVIEKSALEATLCMILATVFLALVPAKYTRCARYALIGHCVLSSFRTFYEAWMGVCPGGFVGNASMNGCLIAVLLPLLFKTPSRLIAPWEAILKVVAVLAAVAAIALTHASIPLGLLVLLIGYGFWSLLGWEAAALMTVFFGAAAWVFFQPMGGHHAFFDDNGRLQVYRWSYTWWRENVPALTGMGLGSGTQMFQRIQRLNGQYANLFPWAHSDWLQIGFELATHLRSAARRGLETARTARLASCLRRIRSSELATPLPTSSACTFAAHVYHRV